MRSRLGLCSAIGLAAAGCVAAPQAATTGDWALVRINGEEPPAEATLRFKPDALGGTAFCNEFSGDYTIERDGQLAVGALHKTQRACIVERLDGASVDLDGAEAAFLSVLAARPRMERHSDRLVLRTSDGRSLEFVPSVGDGG